MWFGNNRKHNKVSGETHGSGKQLTAEIPGSASARALELLELRVLSSRAGVRDGHDLEGAH